MKKWRNIVLLLNIFLKFLNVEASILKNPNVPTATKEIEFELEVTDNLKVDPVYLDFGNILRNSNELNIAQSYFNLSGAFKQDMLVSVSYSEGIKEEGYTQIQVSKENSELATDVLDVYLKNINSSIFSTGEYKIPVVGEIRRVGEISLGKYIKIIKMDVEVQPVIPAT